MTDSARHDDCVLSSGYRPDSVALLHIRYDAQTLSVDAERIIQLKALTLHTSWLLVSVPLDQQ